MCEFHWVLFMTLNTNSANLRIEQVIRTDWVTLGLIFGVYGLWFWALFVLPYLLAVPILIFCLVLHASLTHEVCHGHPLPSRIGSEALVHINPGLAVPYLRFRDTHLAHHKDSILTDPYDDPESNYLDPECWAQMSRVSKRIGKANNTLAGRMILGPILGQIRFVTGDLRAIQKGDTSILLAWLIHGFGAVLVVLTVVVSGFSIWLYVLCCAALGRKCQ